MHIHIIVAMPNKEIVPTKVIQALTTPNLTITCSCSPTGTSSVRYESELALVIPGVIREAIAAEAAGAHAIVIDCMGDPGLFACREQVDIPVVGSAEPAFHLAMQLGHRFGVVTTGRTVHGMLYRLLQQYGAAPFFSGFCTIDVDPTSDYHSPEFLHDLTQACLQSVTEQNADVLVMGSGRLVGYRDSIQKTLEANLGYTVPIIEPLPVAIHMAQLFCHLQLTSSKIAYPKPPDKPIVGYGDLFN